MTFDTTKYLADPEELAALTGGEADNTLLLLRLRTVSRRFREAVGHEVTFVADDEYLANGSGGTALLLPARPIVGTPDVFIGSEQVHDFSVGRRSGVLRRTNNVWPEGLENIRVIYSHGYTTIPDDIQGAVLDMSALALSQGIAGVSRITTGDESVEFHASISTGGTTSSWNDAVRTHGTFTGDES